MSLPDHRELVETLFAYDVVGFQTQDSLEAFHDYVVHEMGGTVEEDGRVVVGERSVLARACPIGIDTDNFLEAARSPAALDAFQRMRESANGRDMIVGVDR
ncbi:trehalose-6-phosphate synthase, partial [Rhizorhabdus sp. FW153]|uniref:trehalose-6-phosphate synthase n=1 Tax=Rhizorhabdus sp. FW153 TaxID=3400216 RepID=UPI003CE986C7